MELQKYIPLRTTETIPRKSETYYMPKHKKKKRFLQGKDKDKETERLMRKFTENVPELPGHLEIDLGAQT
jgi:hypothetical protein